MKSSKGNQETSEPYDEIAHHALVGALSLLGLPLAVGWFGARWWAEHPSAWRNRGRTTSKLIVASGLGFTILGLGVLLLLPAAVRLVWPITPVSLAILGFLWLCLIPAGLLCAFLRVPVLAKQLAEGRANPVVAGRWRKAMWRGQEQTAAGRCGWHLPNSGHESQPAATQPVPVEVSESGIAHPRQVIGEVIPDDGRDPLTRLRDRYQGNTAADWVAGKKVALPLRPQHCVMLAASGAGKTVAAHRMASAALRCGWRVVVIDAKGDRNDAQRWSQLALQLNLPSIVSPTAAFALWNADAKGVAAIAAALLPADGFSGYRADETHAITAVAEKGPWSTGSELVERLLHPARWVGDRTALAVLTAKGHGGAPPPHISTARTVAAQIRGIEVGGWVGPNGWSFDDSEAWRLAVVSLDTASDPNARAFGTALLANLDAYRRGQRRQRARPMLVICDEAASILDSPQAPNLAGMLETMRSQNIGLVALAQSIAGLGVQGERMLDSGAALWAGRMTNPEEIVQRMGTRHVVEVAHQQTGAMLTGIMAAREQQQLSVAPDRVREFPNFRWAISSHGGTTHAFIPPLAPGSS